VHSFDYSRRRVSPATSPIIPISQNGMLKYIRILLCSLIDFICLFGLKANALKRFIPMFDRVLIQRAESLTKTKGGIVIPEKAQQKVLKGTVVAVGPGSRTEV